MHRMNEFSICGDYIHLFSFTILLFRICKYKSSAGISAKTQLLLLLVFSTRYTDLFSQPYPSYNSLFKVFLLCLTYTIVISIYFIYTSTYEKKLDTFRIEFLICGALILGCLFNFAFTISEVAWAFSMYLEAVALWPQFLMISKTRKVSRFIFFYLSALGLYRIFFIFNWIERTYEEDYYWGPISWISGSVQVGPCLIFWVLCLMRVVVITEEETLWYRKNLQENCKQNGIFTINLPNEREKVDKVPLLTNLEQMANVRN